MKTQIRNLVITLALLGWASPSLATCISMRTVCDSMFAELEYPQVILDQVSCSAPGGPVHRTTSITIGSVGPFAETDGVYPQGLQVSIVPLRTPSGGYVTGYDFITVVPGETQAAELEEVFYRCTGRVH